MPRSVGIPRQTLLEASEGIEILVALVAELLRRRSAPRQTDLIAPRGILTVRALTAELGLSHGIRQRCSQGNNQYET